MIRNALLLIAALLLTCSPAPAQRMPAGYPSLTLLGDIIFDDGGLSTDYLTGAVVKSITDDGGGTYTVSFQATDGTAGTLTISGVSTFAGLTDTPSSIVANLCLAGNAAGDALAFVTCGTGGGTGSADGRVSAVNFTTSGNTVTLTVEQTEGVADVTGDFTQPAAPATWAQATGATGTAPVARLGTGTPDNTMFLRGDGTWQVVTAGGGLDQAQVDARVVAGTKVFAQTAGRDVQVGDLDSETATSGHVPTADGSGGVAWMAQTGAGTDTGITQAQADARYAQLAAANTFSAAQTIDLDGVGLSIDARTYTGNMPAFEVVVGPSGDRKAFQLKDGDNNTAWASFEYSVGGAGKQGFALGSGTAGRDVALYRDAANVWRTQSNDAMHVGELRVETGGRANSRTQLGLGTAATAALSDATPETVGTAAAGDSTDVSRANHVHDGVTAFLGLTDSPANYPTGGLDLVRVNAAATGLEFIDEPTPAHEIPVYGALPEFTATSPNIVYLVADYGTGTRTDATLTTGFAGGLSGYSDGEALSEAFGSVSRASPLAALWGQGTAASYNLQLVVSISEDWLNEFTHIVIGGTEFELLDTFLNAGYWQRRIATYPTNLALPEVTINFKRADDSYYFTDNSTGSFLSGIWEKFDGQYSRLTSKGLVHIDGIGEPPYAPTAAAQSYIDDIGRLWISGDMVIHPQSPPMITSDNPLMSYFFVQGSDPFAMAGNNITDGQFTHWSGYFWQRQGANVFTSFWGAVWQYIYTQVPDWNEIGSLTTSMNTTATTVFLHAAATETVQIGSVLRVASNNLEYEYMSVTAVTNQSQFTVTRGYLGSTPLAHSINTGVDIGLGDTRAVSATNRRLHTDSIYIGEFATETLAAEERSLYDDGTKDYYFISDEEPDDVRRIVSFTGPTTLAEDHFFWRGPYIDRGDALDIIEAVVIPNPQFADPTRDLTSIYLDGNVYDVESVIHPNRITGDLRLPTADDWDTACQCSRNIAWDGHQFLKAQRYFVGAHSADAIFTEVPTGTTFDYQGETARYRWRGENSSASPNINQIDGDFYFWSTRLTLREWVASSNRWSDRSRASSLAEAINYVGYVLHQDEALGAVADGDRVIYHREPERARGTVRVTGTEGTRIDLGTEIETSGNIAFFIIQAGNIPASGMIDLKARGANGGSNENIAHGITLTPTTPIAGVTLIQSEGAFTRGDDVSGGRRLFTISDFEPADSVDEYMYRWVPIDIDPEDYERLVWYDLTTGALRNPNAADFDEDHGQSSVIAFDGTELQKASRRVTGASSASGTWTTVPDRTDITGTNNRWRETHWQDYLVDSPEANDVYYNRTQAFREYDGTNWHSVGTSQIFTSEDVEFLGAFNTEQQATDFATEDGQWAIIERSGVPTMQSLSAHSPATPAHYEYFWVPVYQQQTVRVPPVPFTATQDQILRWSQADGQYENTQIVVGQSMTGIGTTADPLAVDVHDIIETLTEHVRYYHTDPQGVTNRGSTVCEVYQTGPYRYGVTHIRVGIDAPPAGAHYRGRIYTIQDNNVIIAKLGDTPERGFSTGGESHYLYFDSDGVPVDDNTRVAICVSRTRVNDDTTTRLYFGDQHPDSPERSYPDADEDWELLGWAQYTEGDPSAGDDTHDHDISSGAQIHGNIEIYYTRTINHGALLGADRVDVDHLNDDVLARLLPENPGDNQVPTWDANTSAWVPEDPPSGSGTGDITGVAAGLGLAGGGTTGDVTLNLAGISTSTDGQVLTSTGSTTAPAWETLGAGSGDITAVITNATSGLTGGAATGDATISLDFRRLTDPGSWTLENDDDYIALYSDDEGSMIRATAREFASGIAATGRVGDITSVVTDATSGLQGGSTSGVVELEMDIKRLAQFPTATETIQGADIIALANESAGGDPTVEITLTEFFADILGDNLSWDATDNQIDATGGGGTGDITSITTPANSGLQLTGCDTGDCEIALMVEGLTARARADLTAADDLIVESGGTEYNTNLGNLSIFALGQVISLPALAAIADTDAFVLNDVSDSNNPKDVTAATISNYVGNRLAGTNLTYNGTTNQLDGPADQITLVGMANVTYDRSDDTDLSTRFGGATIWSANLDIAGDADASINDLFMFQWRDNPVGIDDATQLGIRINGSTALPIRIVEPITNALVNKTRANLARYAFLFLSRQDGVFIELAGLSLSEAMSRLVPTGGTAGQVLTKDTSTDNDVSWTTPVATNLATGTHTISVLEVTSSTGTNVTLPAATDSLAGLMSGSEHAKLGAITTGAEANVQADWDETSTGDDAYIQNKPDIFERATFPLLRSDADPNTIYQVTSGGDNESIGIALPDERDEWVMDAVVDPDDADVIGWAEAIGGTHGGWSSEDNLQAVNYHGETFQARTNAVFVYIDTTDSDVVVPHNLADNELRIRWQEGCEGSAEPTDTDAAWTTYTLFKHDDPNTQVWVTENNVTNPFTADTTYCVVFEGLVGGNWTRYEPDEGLKYAPMQTESAGGGGGILLQKHLVTSATETTLAQDGTWATLMSQEVTVSATDRVMIEAFVSVTFAGHTNATCNLRVRRGSTTVGNAVVTVAGEIHETTPFPILVVEVPTAGTYTYAVQGQDDQSTGVCTINDDSTTSFMIAEVLSPNP